MEASVHNDMERLCAKWDAAVAADARVDGFCSRSAWQISFHEAFAPDRRLELIDQGDAWVLLAEADGPDGERVFEGIENMWGLGSSLVGRGAAGHWAGILRRRPRSTLLVGLPLDGESLSPLLDGVGGRFSVRAFSPLERFVASLDGGFDGWLSRRSASFRRNLRASARRTRSEGVEFRWLSEPSAEEWPDLYRRILELESASWKGRTGTGVDQGPMEAFYRRLLPRLLRQRQLRVLLAQRDGEIVGYLYGAQVGGSFRGLQFSFHDSMRRAGLGNMLQREALIRLCEAGVAEYDLGTPNEYKEAWAERGLRTFSLWLTPR
jgi:CelD/BcsL family acetyltransferase involved in cellulose biosynthesis